MDFGPYDFFKNTPFDLNSDGVIDPSEEAFIRETFYKEDVHENSFDEEDLFDERGISREDFLFMDDDEKMEVLEDMGVDFDDLDSF